MNFAYTDAHQEITDSGCNKNPQSHTSYPLLMLTWGLMLTLVTL